MLSCAGSLRPGLAAMPMAVGSGTRRWSMGLDREPSSPFGERLTKRSCRRSEVLTLPRWHSLDGRPRSGSRQASALHSSSSFCSTCCGQATVLRHCRLRARNPSRASTASAGLPRAANPLWSLVRLASGRSTPPCPRRTTTRSSTTSAENACAELRVTLRPLQPKLRPRVTPVPKPTAIPVFARGASFGGIEYNAGVAACSTTPTAENGRESRFHSARTIAFACLTTGLTSSSYLDSQPWRRPLTAS